MAGLALVELSEAIAGESLVGGELGDSVAFGEPVGLQNADIVTGFWLGGVKIV